MFNGYFNRDSECLIGITGQKLRQFPPYTGFTSLGICRDNETVREMTRGLMKQLGYRGVLDLGYRYDARDGLYKLLDVNPRVGSTFRLFVSSTGLDVVRALYLDLTEQEPERERSPRAEMADRKPSISPPAPPTSATVSCSLCNGCGRLQA